MKEKFSYRSEDLEFFKDKLNKEISKENSENMDLNIIDECIEEIDNISGGLQELSPKQVRAVLKAYVKKENQAKEKVKSKSNFVKKWICAVCAVVVIIIAIPTTMYTFGFDISSFDNFTKSLLMQFNSHFKSGNKELYLSNKIKNFTTVEEAEKALIIDIPQLTWLPKEYKLSDVQHIIYTDFDVLTVTYSKTENNLILRLNIYEELPPNLAENISKIKDFISINGNTYYTFIDNNIYYVSWINENIDYSLSSDLSYDEVVKILDNMK